MTLKLNGSSAGSVSIDAPADTSPSGTDVTLTLPVNDGDSGQYLQTNGSGALSWQTVEGLPDAIDVDASAPADSLAINNSGRVGIGTTNPTEPLTLGFADLGSARIGFRSTTYSQVAMIEGSHDSGAAEGSLRFWTRSGGTESERARITSNGSFCIMSTDTTMNTFGTIFTPAGNTSTQPSVLNFSKTHSGAIDAVVFRYNGSRQGSIRFDNTSTAYNTSSDYRLKENVVNLDGAIDRVKQLAPKRFNFIVDPDKTVDGFIAHEAQTVVPEAVTGVKDEVEVWQENETLPDGVSVGDNKLDEDGNTIPLPQGIDQSKLVPLLTAALQEAIGKIESLETANASLEARLTALEGGAA